MTVNPRLGTTQEIRYEIKDLETGELVTPSSAIVTIETTPSPEDSIDSISLRMAIAYGDLTVQVNPLPGPIPNGSQIRFSDGSCVKLSSAASQCDTVVNIESATTCDVCEALPIGTEITPISAIGSYTPTVGPGSSSVDLLTDASVLNPEVGVYRMPITHSQPGDVTVELIAMVPSIFGDVQQVNVLRFFVEPSC